MDTLTGSRGRDVVLMVACGAALVALAPVALYQTRIVSSIPDPPGAIFDSERIASSKAAHPLGLPDALLGMASFATTLGLILTGKRCPLARQFLGAKLAADGGAGMFNAGRQIVSFGKLCSWCTATALASGVMAFAGRNVIRQSWSSFISVGENYLLPRKGND